jgi:hypothetical protein
LAVSRIVYQAPTSPPDPFPSIFNDPAVSGVQGNINIDIFVTQPGLPLVTSMPLTTLSDTASIITTSFSSKSEGALMLSVDQNYLTYMGYNAAPGLTGVSNSYEATPYDINGDTNPNYDREVALIKFDGTLTLTPEANAYSGDNPRAVITVDGTQYYMAGNSDSTINTTAPNVPGPGSTIGVRYGTPLSSSSCQLRVYKAADRSDESKKQHVKDNNFRGIGINSGTLYVSKGSGGNGDDGMFQVDTVTPLPTTCTTENNFLELFGAPATDPNTGAASPYVPFGFWFANSTTLYVADEGNAPTGFDAMDNLVFTADPLAGLEKWSLVNGAWVLDYVIQNGLNLYQPVNIPNYPAPTYTYGLRNMTGRVNPDGTVTIFAITAQFSQFSNGEPDPTAIVAVTDELSATTLSGKHGGPSFEILRFSNSGEVFRGIAISPCGLTGALANGQIQGPVDAGCPGE